MKAPTRLRVCAGSPVPLILEYATIHEIVRRDPSIQTNTYYLNTSVGGHALHVGKVTMSRFRPDIMTVESV